MPRIESAFMSDVGRKRKINEDYVTTFEPTDPKQLQESGCLYIVADGVGGAARGERVSQFAAGQVLYEYFQHPEIKPGERLRQVMIKVNNEINAFAEQKNARMTTTLVATVVRGDFLTVANVGDSRVYLIRAGEAQQITYAHSVGGELIRSDSMSEAEAQQSKAKNRLSRSLGGDPNVNVDVFSDIPLQPGDKILLCSDGLTRYALRKDISQMTSQGSPKEIVGELVSFANRNGGGDNVSVIVVAYEPVGISAIGPHIPHELHEPDSREDILTEQPAMHGRRKGIPRNATPYLMLSLCILLVAGVVVTALILLLHKYGSTSLAKIGTSLIGTPFSETLPEEMNLTETQSTEALSNEFPISTGTPTSTEAPTFSETPTSQEMAAPTATPAFGSCQYTLGTGKNNWLLNIYYDWYIYRNIPDVNDYYAEIQCAVLLSNTKCKYDGTDPGYILPGWILMIPGVSPNVCLSHGGKYIGGTPIP